MLIYTFILAVLTIFYTSGRNKSEIGEVQTCHFETKTIPNTRLTWNYLFRLIYQSGDVETNPGPFLAYESMLKIKCKYETNLKFLHINAQSLNRKRIQLKILMNDFGVNTVFAITETWLNDSDDTLIWNVLNETHVMFRQDRVANKKKKGGGVALYVPKSFAPKKYTNTPQSRTDSCESVWVECKNSFDKTSNKRLLINVAYSPNKNVMTNFLDFLAEKIDSVVGSSDSLVLMGDYNID